MLINPIQERVQRWSEHRFQKNLFLLRDDLPEVARDMRETASLDEMLDEILAPRRPRRARGAQRGDRQRLRAERRDVRRSTRSRPGAARFAQDYKSDICEPSDKLFPIRVPLDPQFRR